MVRDSAARSPPGHDDPDPPSTRDGSNAMRTFRKASAEFSPEENESRDRLFLATLRIRIPPDVWTGVFSTSHPQVRLEALNRGEISPGVSISDYWISGGPPGVWAKEISGLTGVVKVDSLAQVGGGCIYRVTYRDPPVIDVYRRLRLPVPFPLRIQDGLIYWEVAARYSEFEEFMKFVRLRDPAARVVSIRRRPLRNHLPSLTEHQQQLLTEAMAAGYFAVPRGITLTALAQKLNRSKSSISEAIALIEQKLLETAMRPPVDPL